MAGFFCAVMAIVFALADATLLFGATQPERLMEGVSMALASFAAFAAWTALRSGFRGCIGGVQEALVVVLATMVAGLGAAIPPVDEASADALLATSVALAALSTLAVGASLWLVGRHRLARFVRFVPYPVVAGFLAGTALLLIGFSLALGTAAGTDLPAFAALVDGDAPYMLGLTLALAAALARASREGAPRAAVPLTLVAAVAAFVAVTRLGPVPVERWLADDWMLARAARPASYPPIELADLALVRWDALLAQLPGLAVLIFVALIATLVTVGSLETTLAARVDQDREARVAGAANLVAAAVGGMPGHHALALTTLSTRLRGDSRAIGVIVAALCLAAMSVAGELLTLLPRFVFGALLLWVGASLLRASLLDARRSGPVEALAIGLIAATVVVAGFLPGIVAGLVVGTALFVRGYARLDVVRRECSAAELSSTVDRGEADRRLLLARGHEIRVLCLHGYLFFGTAWRLVERLERREADDRDGGAEGARVEHLVLDFGGVSGIDSTAARVLGGLVPLAEERGMHVLAAAASDPVRAALSGAGAAPEFHATLDAALERAETALLERHRVDVLLEGRTGLDGWLGDHSSDAAVRGLFGWMEPVSLDAGAALFAEGAPVNAVYLVESGRLDIEIHGEDGAPIRVRQVGPGSMIGEVSAYLDEPASASVVAREPSVVLGLSTARLETMLAERPALASLFHRRAAAVLARRLVDNGRTIRTLSSS